MGHPDIGTGRTINPGLMNANKEARKLFYTGAGTPGPGTIVVISGARGQTLECVLASNAAVATAIGPLYMLTSERPADGSTPGFRAGHCKGLMNGVIENQNTSALSVGDAVYLSTNGGWTATKPTSGAVRLIGWVLEVSATAGMIVFCGTPNSPVVLNGTTPVIGKSKAIAAAPTVVFSTSDLGGNYDGRPFVLGAEGTAPNYIQSAAWNGSGSLTVTFNSAATGRVNVGILVTGDDI